MKLPNDVLKKTVPNGSNRYYALCFVDQAQRQGMAAIFALYDEITQIPTRCSEASVAEAKLNWWQCEVEAMFDGKSQHPIMKVLQDLLTKHSLSKSYFYALITGAQVQLLFEQYSTFDDLAAHAQNSQSALLGLLAEACGKPSEQVSQAIAALGIFFRVSDIVCHLRQDLLNNKLYLPETIIEKYQLKLSDLWELSPTTQLTALLADLSRQAMSNLREGLSQIPPTECSILTPVLILIALQAKQLALVKAHDFPVFKHHLVLTPLRQYLLARRIKKLARKQKILSWFEHELNK